ncbi:hypothetical protein B0H13DRAFT_2353987 [Mycena leptocephala]|nr:hypothetical protein B0H13DRAFT_2353987 [Mycena leptocephala]
MSADNNVDAASEVTSPKKTIRTSETDDTSKRLPSLRSDRECPSPGPNRKVSGSGAIRQPAGPDGPNTEFFLSGGSAAETGNLPEQDDSCAAKALPQPRLAALTDWTPGTMQQTLRTVTSKMAKYRNTRRWPQ